MKSWFFLLASCICAVAGEYTISELPGCPGGYPGPVVGITERGAVVWSCWDGFQGERFIFNKQGIRSFGIGRDESLRAVNRHEQVVGWVLDNNSTSAILWT